MENLISKLNTQEIKEQMMLLAPKQLSTAEQKVYGWLFDALESRLSDQDFDYFLDQIDLVISKAA